MRQRKTIPFRAIARTAVKDYPNRTVLGMSLFVGQAFLYNAVTFDLGTLIGKYFGVSSGSVPYWYAVFAVGNLLGPLTLGRLFDTVGRKPMISFCYLASAAVMVLTAILFAGGSLAIGSFMALIVVMFFIASAGASSAYLTVSEIFPMETRALAIAFFYAIGTAAGGIVGPILFGRFIDSGSLDQVALGFYIAAAVMAVGGVAELLFGVRAEGRQLEEIAEPLTAKEAAAAGAAPAGTRSHPPRRRRATERLRFGPGSYAASPGMAPAVATPPPRLERQVEAIAHALEERGPADRHELAQAVGARWWGPGCFREALGVAVMQGRVRRVGRGRFAPSRRG